MAKTGMAVCGSTEFGDRQTIAFTADGVEYLRELILEHKRKGASRGLERRVTMIPILAPRCQQSNHRMRLFGRRLTSRLGRAGVASCRLPSSRPTELSSLVLRSEET